MKTKIRLPCEALAATTEAVVALIGVAALLVPMLVVTVTARAHPRAIPLRAVPAGGLLEAGELKEGWPGGIVEQTGKLTYTVVGDRMVVVAFGTCLLDR
jgi:hypothetical protein